MPSQEDIDYDKVPNQHMTHSIKGYIEHGYPVGHFLTALLSNDLMRAVSRADDNNQRHLVAWCKWLYNEAPARCFGSYEKVKVWQTHRGFEGLDSYLQTINDEAEEEET